MINRARREGREKGERKFHCFFRDRRCSYIFNPLAGQSTPVSWPSENRVDEALAGCLAAVIVSMSLAPSANPWNDG